MALFLLVFGLAIDFSIGTTIKLRLFEKKENFEGAAQLRRQDLLYHHALVANGHTDSADFRGNHYAFSTNSLAFRDREVRTVNLLGTPGYRYRLLFIGDSFVEGLGIEWDSTLVGRVATALAADSVEVLNAGVASYSPVLMERKLRHYLETVGLQVDEVAVAIDVSDAMNEVSYHGPLYTPGRRIDLRAPWRRTIGEIGNYSLLWVTLRQRWHARNASDENQALPPGSNHMYEFAVSRAPWGSMGHRLMHEHLDSIAQLLARHRLPMSLTIYPWPDMLGAPKDVDSPFERMWRTWTASRGVPLFNLFPAFYAAADSAGDEILKSDFFLHDIHWNRRGSARAAESWLQEWCRERRRVTPRACERISPKSAVPQ